MKHQNECSIQGGYLKKDEKEAQKPENYIFLKMTWLGKALRNQ